MVIEARPLGVQSLGFSFPLKNFLRKTFEFYTLSLERTLALVTLDFSLLLRELILIKGRIQAEIEL